MGEGGKGTWQQPGGSRLILFLEPKINKLILPYNIIKLTDERLSIESTFDKKMT